MSKKNFGPKSDNSVPFSEPLLPVEKKLIGWSLGLGVVLLGLLIWISNKFFPG